MTAGVAVLGSTGSIGRQAIEVIDALPERFTIRALAAGRPGDAFLAQLASHPGARAWCPGERPSAMADGAWAAGGLEELATLDEVEIVVVSTTGMAALPSVLAALRAGKTVALANKETLVSGGHLVARELRALGGDPFDRLRPIDSEHSAIWQCLVGERISGVARLVLTASGGPFRGRPADTLASVSPEEALAHPTWRMGPKITIDSATLVNKAFEIIEAKWLYRLPYSRIGAVVHPQSVVHSLVEFVDGSYKAQLGIPDMRLPIQYALTHPDRLPSPAPASAPTDWGSLDFLPLADADYPAYAAARRAAEAGGNRGTILNAADEVAVGAFLEGRVGFPAIAETIVSAVERWGAADEPELDDIVGLDAEVRAALTAEIA
ncbi:MAG TPA: 1-deoxy-D-xylulose-5-phosphate reductoisomerase [Candidatus Limnocylindria bacterium]|nr:1-deoxy-D-xylulose-5-phosphate reductoisomerase [Candidatus Limnocylindria bacterium]